MTTRATGTFDLTSEDFPPYDDAEGAKLLRSVVNKTFHGDIEGTSAAELLKAMATVPGSAGYAGLERVIGTLHGKAGSFVLQHTAQATKGEAWMSVQVVPDTGTGELRGIRGEFQILLTDGKHAYEFDYSLEQ